MESTRGQKLEKIPNKDHYYLDSRSRVIYFVRKVQDEIIKFSTGIKYDGSPSCIIKASRIVSVKEKEKKEVKKKGHFLNILMGEHLDLFLVQAEKSGDKKGTLQSKNNSVKHLKEFFEGHLPSEVTSDEWLAFIKSFQEKNPGFTMFNVTKHFRSVIKQLHENGVITKKPKIYNPNRQKEEVKRRKKRHRPYEVVEILQMDAVCNDDQRLALWLGYNEAFRLDDCVKLNWDRVHLSKSAPFVEFYGDENKTGFTGKVPLSDTSTELLMERRKSAKGEWVFPLVSDPNTPMLSQQIRFEDVVLNSKVKYGSHHILRHTRLTEDFGNPSLPDTLVMKIRRVSLAVALEHYIHPSVEDFEKFRNSGKATRVDKGGLYA